MPKDALLTENFFSLERSTSEVDLEQQDVIELNQLIKQKLYPHLSSEQTPIYYQNERTLHGLNQFVYQEPGGTLYSDSFKALQAELKLTIDTIKVWAERNTIDVESLSGFLIKLEHPTDSVIPLYSEGKKLLEKIAVLLDDPLISLENRQKIIGGLLADNELEHCIAGCYARITSAVLQLQENLNDGPQINRWLQSYTKTMAGYIAAKSPFSLSDSFQELVCKAADSAVDQNTLHANHYLLMQAKKHGFPMHLELDTGAIELGNKLTQLSETAIANVYVGELNQHITAKNLVYYLSEKFHENFSLIMSYEINYTDKITLISNKLGLLGVDSGFTLDELGLGTSGNGRLKPIDSLKITITERLIDRKLIRGYALKNYLLPGNDQLECREFYSAVELTWFWVAGERKRFVQLLREDSLPNSIAVSAHLVKDARNLLVVMKNIPERHREDFFELMPPAAMAGFIKASGSVQLFKELLTEIPDKAKRVLFLEACGDNFIRGMVVEAIKKVDFRCLFPGLSLHYDEKNYGEDAKREGLSITKGLISQLIDNGFKNFHNIHFSKVNHLNYLDDINFSRLNLQNSHFSQPVYRCYFDEAQLNGALFLDHLEGVSFKKTDLREVIFQSLPSIEYSHSLMLEDAVLSTGSFKELRVSHAVTQFRGANLKEVNFQEATVKNYLEAIDFSVANLESADLSYLELNYAKFHGTNLEQTKLQGSFLGGVSVDENTKLKGSVLGWSDVIDFYKLGIRNFEACHIHLDTVYVDGEIGFFKFSRVNFKAAMFTGNFFSADFIESNLSGAQFRPKLSAHEPSLLLSINIRAIKSNFDFVSFHQVAFVSTAFIDSTLTHVVFNQVEMQSDLLFAFYKAGHRDFKGVRNLKGAIPKNLMSFPVLEAELNKKIFVHLYRQGLRDFRGSSLNGFYLSEVLKEQAISEIDLKLEGAHYKPSLLGCTSSSRQKRGINTVPTQPCKVHILFQRAEVKEKQVSLEDIELLLKSAGQQRFALREAVLNAKPLFFLQDAENVSFHWGYLPDEDSFIQSLEFVKASIATAGRHQVNLSLYFPKQFQTDSVMLELAQQLGHTGFSEIRLYYYNSKKQLVVVQLKNRLISVIPAAMGEEQIFSTSKFRSMDTIPSTPKETYNKMKQQLRLRRISLSIKKEMGSGLRGGLRRGAQYEIGATILYFVGQIINGPSTPEVRLLDTGNKTTLKALANYTAEEIGLQRGARTDQIRSAIHVAGQCIDRGECSNEELVVKDVMDSMYRMRPDLMIGNEYGWNQTKNYFTELGDFLEKKWDDIKQAFQGVSTFSFNQSIFFPPPLSLGRRKIVKRILPNWYEQPLLMRLIKQIEIGFDRLGYDLNFHPQFSYARLAGILHELWQACEVCNQTQFSNASKAEAILNFLTDRVYQEGLVTNTTQLEFEVLSNPAIESFKHDSVPVDLDQNATTVNNLNIQAGRNKRSISVMPTQRQARKDRIQEIAEDYLRRYDHPKQRQQLIKANQGLGSHQSIKRAALPSVMSDNSCTRQQVGFPNVFSKKNSKRSTPKVLSNQYPQKTYQASYTKKAGGVALLFSKPEPVKIKKMVHTPPPLPKNQEINFKLKDVERQIAAADQKRLTSYFQYQSPTQAKAPRITGQANIPGAFFLLKIGFMLMRGEKHQPLSVKADYLQQRAEKQIERNSRNVHKAIPMRIN